MEDKSVINRMSELLGNSVSTNAQNSTDISIEGMKLFRKVAHQKYNVGFEQVKGNLFEYIEAAKFNVDAAKKGNTARAIVTDSVGRPHDPADIEIVKGSKVVKQVQAKFSTSKNAALDSVRMQSNSKYRGMDRLIRKDNNYTDDYSKEKTSLLKRTKELANKASRREGNIYQEDYKDKNAIEIKTLLETKYGLKVTIATDDLLFFGSDINEEYLKLYKEGTLTVEQLDKIRLFGLSLFDN